MMDNAQLELFYKLFTRLWRWFRHHQLLENRFTPEWWDQMVNSDIVLLEPFQGTAAEKLAVDIWVKLLDEFKREADG